MKTHLFKMECLTDLHVGSGEANYSVIDNEVQKDTVLTHVPIIHASGVKGALKEHFERSWGKGDARIKAIFGDKDGAGDYKFFTAQCLVRPLRVSNGDYPYILCTGEDILKSFSKLLSGLGLSGFYEHSPLNFGEKKFISNASGTEIEGDMSGPLDASGAAQFKRFDWGKFAVAKSLSDYDLPIRARNVLDENGMSKNLWYEELVPHKSLLYFAIITQGGTDEQYQQFKEVLEEPPIQFGGNASIGNGYTSITEVSHT